MAVAKAGGQIVIAPIEVEDIAIHVIGQSPLVVHRFAEKATRQMLHKQMNPQVAARKNRDAKVPVDDFLGALHVLPPTGDWNGVPTLVWWDDPDGQHANGEPVAEEDIPDIVGGVAAVGRFGFPAVGFKAAAVRAAKAEGVNMTDARMAFLVGSTILSSDLVEVEAVGAPGPIMRMDIARTQTGVADVRFRPEFTRWKAKVPVRINLRVMSVESCLSLFKGAGFGVGVGEWRTEKDGVWGSFDVVGVDRIGGKSL